MSGRLRLIVIGVVLLVLLVAGGLGFLQYRTAPAREAERLAHAGELGPALEQVELATARAGESPALVELKGFIQLLQGRRSAGEATLAGLAKGGPRGSRELLTAETVGQRLLDAGREAELGVLCDHLDATSGGPLSPTMTGLAGLAALSRGELKEAIDLQSRALESGSSLPEDLTVALTKTVDAARLAQRSGRVTVIEARDGRAMAWRGVDGARPLQVVPELRSLLGNQQIATLPGIDAGDLDGVVQVSLDFGLQGLATRLLRREEGAFVAFDVATGELLAAAASGPEGDVLGPFDPRFQPGSTLKVLTQAAYLEAGLDPAMVVPHHCKGNDYVVEGKIAYDWAAHGNMDNVATALSASCNTVFCKMGLELRDEGLRSALDPFHFDGLDIRGSAGEVYPAGAFAPGPLLGMDLARASIGLGETRVSALQSALIALTLARGGERVPPTFIREKRNVAGSALPLGEGPAPERVLGEATVRELNSAMRRVVEDPEGTGRGLKKAGVPVAAKTGTTGGDGGPLNAAFIGWMPADEPRLAFAAFTVGSGRSLEVSRRALGPFLEEVWREIKRRPVASARGR
ncbi:MAG: penicillin-binding transpeptidase domain-containing protein [Acidobacteriota bacterium]